MKLFSLTLLDGAAVQPTFGFPFILESATREALLDDDMITVRLDPELYKRVKEEQFNVFNGFISLPSKVLTEDVLEDKTEAVLLHVKIRLSRTSPPCIIKTITEEHVPVLGLKSSDWEKSLIFQIGPELPVTITIGRAEYSFEYKNDSLGMFNKTEPTWPSLPPPAVGRKNRVKWFLRFFARKERGDARPPKKKTMRYIPLVDAP